MQALLLSIAIGFAMSGLAIAMSGLAIVMSALPHP
jgi:hypothetical protein